MKKIKSLESVNGYILNEKIEKFITENKIQANEQKCRFVKITLRHPVHHFPTGIPFIAAVRNCADEKNVVIGIKRNKIALIDQDAISSQTNVGDTFEINNISYKLKDTLNGFPRYEPILKK